jgi:hypothetical protein
MTFDEWWKPKEKEIKESIHSLVAELAEDVKVAAKDMWNEIEKSQNKTRE